MQIFKIVFDNEEIVQYNMYLHLMKNKNLTEDWQSNLFPLFKYMNAFQKAYTAYT